MDELDRELARVRDTCFVYATRRTANLLTRFYDASLAEVGLEATRFMLLTAIASEKANSAVELARLLGLERSTIARNLERLMAEGWVLSRPGEGRRILYRVTSAGRERLAKAVVCWANAQAAILAALPEDTDVAVRYHLASLDRTARRVIGEADGRS